MISVLISAVSFKALASTKVSFSALSAFKSILFKSSDVESVEDSPELEDTSSSDCFSKAVVVSPGLPLLRFWPIGICLAATGNLTSGNKIVAKIITCLHLQKRKEKKIYVYINMLANVRRQYFLYFLHS